MGRFGRKSRLLAPTLAILLPAAAWVLCSPALLAQFGIDVRLVRMLVTVKDAAGTPIGTLEKGDFKVFDAGVEKNITVFEHHTELPLSISVLVDISGTVSKDLEYEVDSVDKFFRALFREGNTGDAASVIAFNHDVTQVAGFTRRQQNLRNALRSLKATSGTSLYDAIVLGARTLEDREGRHVLVIVTDGGDTTSTHKFQEALDAAQYAEAAVYPILVVPIANDAGRNLGGERALARLALDTGGRVFTPAVGPQLDAAFTEILRDLRTQYLIGFQPGAISQEPRFRPVEIRVARPGLQVLTRSGYYVDSK